MNLRALSCLPNGYLLAFIQVSVSDDEINHLLKYLPDCNHVSFFARQVAFFHSFDISRILEPFRVDKKEGLRNSGIYFIIQRKHPSIKGNPAPAGGRGRWQRLVTHWLTYGIPSDVSINGHTPPWFIMGYLTGIILQCGKGLWLALQVADLELQNHFL